MYKILWGGFFMHKYRRSIWTNTLPSIALSSLFGSLCGLISALIFSAFVFFFMDDWKFIGILSSAALVTSGFSGAFLCGKYRRRRGITEGMICGIIIFALLFILGTLIFGKVPGIKKLALLTVSGMLGGVSGVNSKRPKNLMT